MSDGKLTHCPKCHKPLLNGAKFLGNAQFNLRCPWCQSIVTVTVQQQITANLKPENNQTASEELAEFYGQPASSSVHTSPAEGFKVVGFLYPQQKNSDQS